MASCFRAPALRCHVGNWVSIFGLSAVV
uniref:Uncharacterized protein n=1 Tax=Anguilla anguilla TaxID=7936 RepID=A0A0E9VKP5_ANGAN